MVKAFNIAGPLTECIDVNKSSIKYDDQVAGVWGKGVGRRQMAQGFSMFC